VDGEAAPQEPLTELAANAAQLHEAFMAYVQAGFTRDEALRIVIAFVTASIGS
jgi:hypothetical protein